MQQGKAKCRKDTAFLPIPNKLGTYNNFNVEFTIRNLHLTYLCRL